MAIPSVILLEQQELTKQFQEAAEIMSVVGLNAFKREHLQEYNNIRKRIKVEQFLYRIADKYATLERSNTLFD